MSGRSCPLAGSFFEAEPLGAHEEPDHAGVCLDTAHGQFRLQLAHRERAGAEALTQPRRRRSRQPRPLVAADPAMLQTARLTLQLPPLRYAGRADLQRIPDRSDRRALLCKQKRAFTKVFRIIPTAC
jgi:hypothetical protein